MTSCQRGKQWDITSSSDASSGWVICNYNYDFSTYAYQNPSNSIYNFSEWLNDIFSSGSPSAPQGMDIIAKLRIRDSNVLYALIFDFYNQIYNTGFYMTAPMGTNLFSSFDFLTQGFQPFISNYIDSTQGYFSQVYQGNIPDELMQCIINVLIPPKPIQNTTNPDTYYILLNFTWTQYNDFLNSSDQAGYINNCMNFLLRDSQAEFQNMTSGGQWTTGGPSFINPNVNSFCAIQLIDKNGQQNYQVVLDIVPSEWNAENYGNCLFGTAQVLAEVNTWSPMLVAYFTSLNSTISFSKNTCQVIASQCGEGCIEKSTIPTGCFSTLCTDPNSCKETLANYCSLVYDPPNNILSSETDNLLVTNNNSNCLCYTSTLPPAINYTPGNLAAMCFDSNCNPSLRGDFGLDDSTCSKYCNTVWGWMNSTNPATQSQNQEYMDWVRFKTICGDNFKPYTPSSLNKSVLISGILVSILIIALIFSICKHLQISQVKMWILIVVFFLFFLGITIFLSKDLAGLSSCDGKNFVCTSKITKKNIPKEFCNFVLNCECESDQDCPGNCVCASTTCKPQTGSRPYKNVTVRQSNIPLATTCISLGIIIPTTLIYLHDDYHWKIDKKYFSLFVISLGIVLICIGLYAIFKKATQQIFTSACCSPNCEDKECGEDGCGGSCGNCASGTCMNGKCEKIIDGCPYPGSENIVAPTSLDSGSYSIQYQNGNYNLTFIMNKSGYPVLLESISGILPIYYDASESTLTYSGLTLVAKDFCLNTVCGNDKNISCTQQAGLPSGILYTMDSNLVNNTIPHLFILGKNTIFSVEANAYIIPDSRQGITGNECPNCEQGNMGTITYTIDLEAAQVWTITQLNI